MTTYLVLDGYRDSSRNIQAGTKIDDSLFPVASLIASGLAAVPYDAASMDSAILAWQAQAGTTFARPLSDFLAAAGGGDATKGYVDQPAVRVVTGATDAPTASDIGKAVAYTHAGAVAVTVDDLSAGVVSGKLLIILYLAENALTAPTFTPAAGCTINGGGAWSPVAGPGVYSLISRNGKDWFHA